MRYVVALYEIDLAFGGPEEGGWWFETGRLARLLRLYPTEAGAVAAARRADALLARLQRRRRPLSSAAYEGGRYAARVFERVAPEQFPETRPRYA